MSIREFKRSTQAQSILGASFRFLDSIFCIKVLLDRLSFLFFNLGFLNNRYMIVCENIRFYKCQWWLLTNKNLGFQVRGFQHVTTIFRLGYLCTFVDKFVFILMRFISLCVYLLPIIRLLAEAVLGSVADILAVAFLWVIAATRSCA